MERPLKKRKNAPDERVVVHDDEPLGCWCRAAEESSEDGECLATVSCKQRQASRMSSTDGRVGALLLATEIS